MDGKYPFWSDLCIHNCIYIDLYSLNTILRKCPIINESCILGVICFCYDDITIIEVRHIITNKCKNLIEKRKRHMMGPKKHSKKENWQKGKKIRLFCRKRVD